MAESFNKIEQSTEFEAASKFRNKIAKPVAVLAAFVIILAINLWLVQMEFGQLYEADFIQNTWLGGYLIVSGQIPYDPVAWQAAKDAFLPRPDIFPYYIYPIWVAILVAPLGFLPPLTALAVWTSINIVLLYVNLTLTYQITGVTQKKDNTIFLLVVSFLYVPNLTLLWQGQYNMVLLFIVLLSIARMQASPSWLGGVLLALTTGKPQSFGLVVAAILWWALVRGRWREIFGFIGGCAILWLAPLVFYPNWWTMWLTITREQSVRIVEITPSFWGVAYQLETSLAWLVAVGLSLTLLLGSMWWWLYLKAFRNDTRLWEVAAFTIIGLLISFYGLHYEQVSLLFPFWLCWQWADNLMWRLTLVSWIIILPIAGFVMLAIKPPDYLVFSIAQPLTLLPIYVFLEHKNRANTQAETYG